MFDIKVLSGDSNKSPHNPPSSQRGTPPFDVNVGKKSSSVSSNKSCHSPERSVGTKNTRNPYQTNTNSPTGVIEHLNSPHLWQDYKKSPFRKILSFEKFSEHIEAYKNAGYYTDHLTLNEFINFQLTNLMDHSDESVARYQEALKSIDYPARQEYDSDGIDPIINMVVTFSSEHRQF
jgi:hypothetical protein